MENSSSSCALPLFSPNIERIGARPAEENPTDPLDTAGRESSCRNLKRDLAKLAACICKERKLSSPGPSLQQTLQKQYSCGYSALSARNMMPNELSLQTQNRPFWISTGL